MSEGPVVFAGRVIEVDEAPDGVEWDERGD